LSAASDKHNRLAPEILKRIVTETDSPEAAWVVLESVMLGMALFFYDGEPRKGAAMLDEVLGQTLKRLGQ
jgi:hypothetical protein